MKVIDAINILRYEKIGRWVSKMWVWAEDPRYDPIALSIAEGKQDKIKQDALYVRLTNDGRIASVPSETTYDYDMVRAEIDKGTRFANFIDHFVNDGFVGLGVDYNKVEEAFTILFTESKEV